MAGQPIDYEALARQARGGPALPNPASSPSQTIDYDALARQARGGPGATPAAGTGVSGFIGNVFGSGGRLTSNTVDAIVHPIDTLGSIASIPVGLYQKAGGPVPAGFDDRRLKLVDAMIDHMRERYGSLDAAKKTLYEDPVGVMADLSTALGGAGGILGKAGEVSRLGAVTRAGGMLSKASAVTDPVNLVVQPLKAAAAAGAARTGLNPQDLYRTALKPRINTPVEDVRQMVQTGLEHALPVSESGADKLQGLITDLQQAIESKTKAAAAAGVTLDPGSVASRTAEVEQRLGSPYSQVNPVSDRQAIERSRAEFLAQHSTAGTPGVPPQPTGLFDASGRPILTPAKPPAAPAQIPIPADYAHQMKTGTYQKIREEYGSLSTAQVEAQKALARGLKEELTTAIPELSGLNEKQGKLLDLQPVLESAVNRAANRTGWFKNMLTTAAATTVAGKPIGAVYSVLSAVLDDPAVRSRLAIAINKAQQNNPSKWGAPNVATSLSRVNEYATSIKRALDQQPVNP
jgi:hypothetical protein